MTPSREARIQYALSRRQPDITVVLENVMDPHNIAAVLRSADAVGVAEIYVLNTGQPPRKTWADRSARSADKWIIIHEFTSCEECVLAVRKKYNRLLAAHVGDGSHSLYELDLCAPVALVFGNERHGLTPEMLAACNGSFVIPQVGMVLSLNISVACAICLYEAYRQRLSHHFYDAPRLSDDECRQLYSQWSQPWLARQGKDNK